MNDYDIYNRVRGDWDRVEEKVRAKEIMEERPNPDWDEFHRDPAAWDKRRGYPARTIAVTLKDKTAEARAEMIMAEGGRLWAKLLADHIDYDKCARLKVQPIPDLAVQLIRTLAPDRPDLHQRVLNHVATMGNVAQVLVPRPPKAPKTKPERPLTNEERRDWAVKKGALPLERSAQEIVWNLSKVDVHAGQFDHHIGQVLIVLATRLLEDKTKTPFDSLETFLGIHDLLRLLDPKDAGFWGPELRFTDRDFNRILRKNLSSRNIERIVSKLPTLIFRVMCSLKVPDEKGHETWKDVEITDYDNIAGVEVVKVEGKKRGRGAGEERRGYRVYFKSRIGLAFWHNIASGGYSLLTRDKVKAFLDLTGSGQMIVWAVWQWKDDRPAILSLDQLFGIMGWQRATRSSDFKAQVRRLASILNRLVKDGFLREWAILPSGAYHLVKVAAGDRPYITA